MDKILENKTRIIAFLRSLLFAYILSGLLLFLLAFLMLKLDLAGTIVSAGIIIIYILSCFTGGFFIGKREEQKRFIWGLAIGVVYFVILVIISTVANTFMGMDTSRMLSVFLICAFSGMLGGMLS